MTRELALLTNGSSPLAAVGDLVVPAAIMLEGERAAVRYIEFFTANIRNRNTRTAYARAASDFFAWCDSRGLTLPTIQPVHVAAWVEQQGRAGRSAGLRDRALIGTLLYTFGRIGAVITMRVGDYYPVGKRWWVRLHEKGGKEHEVPVHHTLQEWLDAYIGAAGIEGEPKGFLFRTAEPRSGRLTTSRCRRRMLTA